MTAFRPGAVARVPFPYTDRTTRQHRPAVVVSAGGLGPAGGQLWVVMVTSSENRRWPGDVSLEEDYRAAGLPAPSLIRTEKVATVDAAAVEWRGDIGAARLTEVLDRLQGHLGLTAA